MADAERDPGSSTTDTRSAIARAVGEALTAWPPLFTVEDLGRTPNATYVAVRLDPITGEYYPFDGLLDALNEAGIVAEVVGLDTTRENELPRLILRIDERETTIDEAVMDDA